MSFTCKNHGVIHRHDTIVQSKICWGILPPPTPIAPPPSLVTDRQIQYIRDLGGDALYAAKLTREQASDYISKLKLKPQTPKEKRVSDPRLDLIKGMIDLIPEGYYAVQEESGARIDFVRLSRPKPNARTRYAGCTKFQTQHGPQLDDAAVIWPSGNWSIWKNSITDMLMLLVADHHSAAMRYAREIGRCMRCNAELTDDRSRHYGIGPDCEHKNGWGWVIPTVDEKNSATFETLRARGLINVS